MTINTKPNFKNGNAVIKIGSVVGYTYTFCPSFK